MSGHQGGFHYGSVPDTEPSNCHADDRRRIDGRHGLSVSVDVTDRRHRTNWRDTIRRRRRSGRRVGGRHQRRSTSGAAPQIEFGIRHGLTDNLDIGGKIYVAGLELGVKYQYLTGSFDGAIAPAISGMYFGTSEGSGGFLYIHLPFLFDVDVSDTFSFAFGPKFLYAVVFGDVTEGEDDIDFSSDGLLGGLYLGFPFRLGDAFWLVPEINLYTGLATEGDAFDVLLWQGGIGLLFGGGPADEPVAAP